MYVYNNPYIHNSFQNQQADLSIQQLRHRFLYVYNMVKFVQLYGEKANFIKEKCNCIWSRLANLLRGVNK